MSGLDLNRNVDQARDGLHPAPKPRFEMTAYEREGHDHEVMVDYLIDEAPFAPFLELAQGLMEDTEEFGQVASFRMAGVLRRRASASSLGPQVKRPLTAPPAGPKPPPIRSRPVKLGKVEETSAPKLL